MRRKGRGTKNLPQLNFKRFSETKRLFRENKKTKREESKHMKTLNKKNILGAGIAFAIALTAWMPVTSKAADEKPMKPMKGGEHQLMLNGINTKEEVDALKNDDSVAMVCAKCKTVWVSRVRQGAKGAELLGQQGRPTEIIGTHACKGCNSTLTVAGVQKGSHLELKHSCGACGDDSAFCCATKAGSATTKGMQHDK
jgi:hypothetical protein